MTALPTVQLTQIYLNAHRKENTEPIELVQLMPCPAEWHQQSMQRELNISRFAARAVLESVAWLQPSILIALEGWMGEIELIARGD